MTEDFFPVAFTYHGVAYEGRVCPEHIENDDAARSYHVVLNNVFFGYVSKDGKHWNVNEQRPQELVELVGSCIDFNILRPAK